MKLFGRDKKQKWFHFVLDGPEGLEVVEGIPENLLRKILENVGLIRRDLWQPIGVSRPVILLLSGPNLNLLGGASRKSTDMSGS